MNKPNFVENNSYHYVDQSFNLVNYSAALLMLLKLGVLMLPEQVTRY